MEDANRELRAMLFSLLHLPPLPAVMGLTDREDNTVLSTDHAESSHTLLASLIEWTAAMDNQRFNSERMFAQMLLQAQFHEELLRLDADCPPETLYNFYCHHTRLWVNAYTPTASRLLFKPLDSICVGDTVHRNMLSYAKAQYHHFKDGAEELEISDRLSFADVMRKCAEWSREWNKHHTLPPEPSADTLD
jgi:hypothetical protein